MVFVYAKQSELNRYIGENLDIESIENSLKELGMDVKGISEDSDPELKIEITPEKIDMVSAKGIGRAIRYYMGFEKESPNYSITRADKKLYVENEEELARPKTVAAIIRNFPMDETLLDEIIRIQEKLHESHGRNRKKAAIGIYPLDNIEFPITYTPQLPSEIVFKPLESDKEMDANEILSNHETGQKYGSLLKGYNKYPIFKDSKGKILSMPPIINSQDTGRVGLENKDLFIECSGHNLYLLDNILKVLVTTFVDIGGEVEAVEVEYPSGENYILDLSNRKEIISLEYINSLIGINIEEEEVIDLLRKMMYGVGSVDGGEIEVEIPSFRQDVWNDCDIADDVARAYGYNNIGLNFPTIASVGGELEYTRFRDQFTQSLISMGYLELYTYLLTSSKYQYNMINLEKDDNYLKLLDSTDEGINMIRKKILPSQLEALSINKKHKYPQKVFENGFTIHPDETKDVKARDDAHLAVSIADTKANYTDIKRVLDTLSSLTELEFDVVESNFSYFIEGRSGTIYYKNTAVGEIGEIHPQVLENFGFTVPIASFELDLELIWSLK